MSENEDFKALNNIVRTKPKDRNLFKENRKYKMMFII